MSEQPAFLLGADTQTALHRKTSAVFPPDDPKELLAQFVWLGGTPIIIDDLDEYGAAPLPRTLPQAIAREPRQVALPLVRVRPRRLLWVAYACCGAVVALAAALRWV